MFVRGLIRRPKPRKRGFLRRPKSQEFDSMKLWLVRHNLTELERLKNKTSNDANWYHFKGKSFSASHLLCERTWDKLLFFWSHIDLSFENHQWYLRGDTLLVKYWPKSNFKKILISIKLIVRKKCGGMFWGSKCSSTHMLTSSMNKKTILHVWKSRVFPFISWRSKMMPIGIISGLFWIS